MPAEKKPKQYWLVKSESFKYSWDEFVKDGWTYWDGVRNYQARNLLRDDMHKDDEVLYYHSRVQPIGVAGVARISRGGYPDPEQFNPKSKYFDAKSNPEDPRWFCVEITHVRTFDEVIPLAVLKEQKALSKMMVTQRGARLSVQPVTAAEFRAVLKMAAT